MPPRRPKTPPRRPQDGPGAAQEQILVDFGGQHPSKLAPGTHPRAILCGNRLKAKKYDFRNIILLFLLVLWNIFSIKIHLEKR